MAVLTEGSFELNGYKFGGDSDPLLVVPGGFDPGTTSWRTSDRPNPAGDNVRFGRDFRTPPTWTWALQTNKDTAGQSLDALEEASQAWLGEAARGKAGAVLELRYRLGGRDRLVYGRPRRFSYNIDPSTWVGVSAAVADFACVDSMSYDDVVRTAELSILPGTTTGLTSPLIGSLSTTSPNERAVSLSDVGGKAPAPFTALIKGPIVNPWISEDGWRIDINTTLAYDQTLLIDTRPWALTVLRSDGVSLAGSLSRTSRLNAARLKPGGTTLRFGGKDATGTATCSVKWRPTYYSL